MSTFPSELLLYPQTFLAPEKIVKIFPIISKIIIIKLPKTFNILENIYKELTVPWKEKINFLEFRENIRIDWNEISREIDVIEEWGLNFRTPENLKYFSQFKEILEESLEGIFPLNNSEKNRNKFYKELEIKRALIILSLAESLDFKMYEVEKSLKEMEEKYSQMFEEKIIGEDFTFEKILKIEEPIISSSEEVLPNLNLRISAWKIIGKYLNWDSIPSLNNLLITEKELLDEWKEKFTFEKIDLQSKDIEFYKFKASLFKILEISEDSSTKFSFPETGIVFLNF
ncbi:MAG: hypothetical protein MW689_000040 [Thermodesulfobacteria bacterium]|nr:hypothetical protein [Thermodesulfobacteriota bacterium]MCU4138251.1 hypothetical protein [Thermodesulfobacteriota bacterium]